MARSFEDLAVLLASWIETSFSERVHLVGNSMGGQIAIHLAATRPDLVQSLTLVDSTGIPFDFAPFAHLRNFVVPHGALSFARILARDFFRNGPISVAVALARLLRDDARPLMRRLKLPVLLVWGDRDPLVPLRYAEAMKREMPQSRLVVIPRAGHVPQWESPAKFNDALLEFTRGAHSDQLERGFSWGLGGSTNGIAHREAGTRRDVVLVHGLGMSSAYFRPLAQALFARGIHAIAPDLPGFGESDEAPASSPSQHARMLTGWADALALRDPFWIGHSLGCNAVAHIQSQRRIAISPLWSPRSPVRLLPRLLLDGFREPLAVWPVIVGAYWRCGLARWIGTLWKARHDPPQSMPMIAGVRDPLVDRNALRDLIDVPGAHACHFSHPDATADAIMALIPRVSVESGGSPTSRSDGRESG